jgi:hypothetical protein
LSGITIQVLPHTHGHTRLDRDPRRNREAEGAGGKRYDKGKQQNANNCTSNESR